MARLYSLLDATAHDEPGYGRFEAGPDGEFPFPDEVSARLGRIHHGGQKAWETQAERLRRLHGEDLARRRDPAALYDAVGEFTAAMKAAVPAASPDVAALIAQVAALSAQVAELSAAGAEDDGEPGSAVRKAAPRARKTAAAAD
jgi:hypothetical protein